MKTRNKKRLITLVLVFALVFLTGAAFAFTAGILDIVGTVQIAAPDDLYVVWHTAEALQDPLEFVEHTADIVNRDGPGTPALTRTAQRIVWEIDFDSMDVISTDPLWLGTTVATLHATAMNESFQNATITRVDYEWLDFQADIPDDRPFGLYPSPTANVLTPADFGLEVTIDQTAFVGPLASRTESGQLAVSVRWNGLWPEHFFNVGRNAAGDPVAVGTEVLVGHLVIEFEYEPAA